MRIAVSSALLGCALSFPAYAQTTCAATALPQAARVVAAVRHQLHGEAVGELDPVVPAPIAGQLAQLKNALAQAADAAMACAAPTITPESLQKTLADALHANLSAESETTLVTAAGKDRGAYGSDLDVQVLPLSSSPSSPRYLEIDLRYGVECGDDNLLLVYKQTGGAKQADDKQPGGGWRPVLRWDAPGYRNIGGAFGDFILLTPLTGLADKPNWRVVVAHGQPSCYADDSHSRFDSRFDLDLLQPGADPAHPAVVWHLERPYRRTDTPRLATTEETLTFQLLPQATARPQEKSKSGNPHSAAPAAQIYRYRVSSDNQVEVIDSPGATTPVAPGAATPGTARPMAQRGGESDR